MEFTDFLTIDFVLSFPGMIIICWLVVQATKNLVDKALNELKTRWVVLAVALTLVGVKTLLEPGVEQTVIAMVVTILMWLINALAVWLATLKAHETFFEG